MPTVALSNPISIQSFLTEAFEMTSGYWPAATSGVGHGIHSVCVSCCITMGWVRNRLFQRETYAHTKKKDKGSSSVDYAHIR